MDGRLYEAQQQHLLDLQDSSGFGSDAKSWLSGDDLSRTLSSLTAAAATANAAGTVDRVLFNDLVEMVPLVQSLIDRKANSSFTRRGSMIYTKTPSRESLYKKTAGRNASLSTKKARDQGDKDPNRNASQDTDNLSVFSSRTSLSEKDREELMALRDQVEDLKRQLSEKDELLKSAELSMNEMASIHTRIDELESETAEKDSLIKSTQLQLSDAKVKLADKQAAVEKLQWEAMTSNKKVERLQEDLEKVQGEISSFMLLIEGLTRNDFAISAGDYDNVPYPIDQNHEIDREMDMQELEAAREAYITAVAAAKARQDEESVYAAARARFGLTVERRELVVLVSDRLESQDSKEYILLGFGFISSSVSPPCHKYIYTGCEVAAASLLYHLNLSIFSEAEDYVIFLSKTRLAFYCPASAATTTSVT
ncbi:hypothetical protein C2S53_014204 [Perilla frutescens var. hirtella]|uniref:Uncharacterized protein n=1 Tax=Perilla frutescens var. hirtella TaxID=608512 RepID=A0AAD4P6P4_PERFH|nr:hypothetical protein C2S53_014204 [Perilla frutescens var. hirtella]